MLSQLCFPEGQSHGRRYPEPHHAYRGLYQRDRDRIIHARAFRRLEHKTQVFTSPLSDHFRNRLTHTIEVVQIARTVAAALELNEDLTEALALSHDIGHPPFGHAGEEVLDAEMRHYGGCFDHNLHALRVVETFEQRYAAFPGLNLTFEVREGIVKHSHDYDPVDYPELVEYLLDYRPPLEAQLINLADEITYDCADLDDAVDAGMLRVEEIRDRVGLFRREWTIAEKQFSGATARQVFNETLRKLLDRLVSALVQGTQQAVEAAGLASIEDVRRHPVRVATLTSEEASASRELRAILAEQVYNSPTLDDEHRRATEKLAKLFQMFMDEPSRLPISYRRRLPEEKTERAVCDYLASMTDKFLLRQYAEIFGTGS